MRFTQLSMGLAVSAALLLGGCASQPQAGYDYTAFRQANPRSILVLPPLNSTTDVNASFSMLAQTSYPLAESGYYVMPVTLVSETFKHNGLNSPAEIHNVPLAKLKEIFGADAVLYITVTRYGASYNVVNSAAVVSADAKLVDLSTGATLWTGSASASNESNNNSGGGLAGLLVAAIVKQIVNHVSDASHPVAGMTSQRLLTAGSKNGLLYGPRSPNYGKEGQPH